MSCQSKTTVASAWLFFLVAGIVAGGLRAQGATLAGSFSGIAQGSNVNLTAVGVLDWVHWGLYTDTSVNRKANVVPFIGDFTVVGNTNGFLAVYQYADNFNGYSWSDGTPIGAVTNTPTGVWAYGAPNLGSGFELTAPADTNARTLQVFVGVFRGRGSFQASLSDGSAAPYSNSALANLQGNGPGGVYTITYAAGSAGQTLHIRWTLSQGTAPDANVTLQAAALTSSGANNPPFVALTSPTPYASFAALASVALQATAADVDGAITHVEFFEGTNKLGQSTTAPYTFDWNDVSKGHYVVCAKATDNRGATSECKPVEIFVHTADGTLSSSVAQPPASVDLTSEGSTDWIHWGYTNASSVNRKAGFPLQISTFTKIGHAPVQGYSDNYTGYSWSDGTPIVAAVATHAGICSTGVTNGFALTVPADTSARTVRVYVGLYGAEGSFLAYVSDLSGPAYFDTSLSNVYGNSYAVYTLTFAAASAGQTLNLRFTSRNLFDQTYGNVTLQAATLAGGTIISNQLPTVVLTNPPNDAVFVAPTNLLLEATASDPDGFVAKVEFYNGTTKLGESTSGPYSLVWSNGPAGNYTLTARATDNLGGTATSAPVSISVQSPLQPVTLLNPKMIGTDFSFSFSSQTGCTYTAQFTPSLNPTNWQDFTNLPGNGAVVTITNQSGSAPQRYYRVRTD